MRRFRKWHHIFVLSSFLDSNFVFFGIWIPFFDLESKKLPKRFSDSIFEIYAKNDPRVQIFMKKHLNGVSNEMVQISFGNPFENVLCVSRWMKWSECCACAMSIYNTIFYVWRVHVSNTFLALCNVSSYLCAFYECNSFEIVKILYCWLCLKNTSF